jgi:hypothetical protein
VLLHAPAKACKGVLRRLGDVERLPAVVRPLNERPIIQVKWLALINHASTLFFWSTTDKSNFGKRPTMKS